MPVAAVSVNGPLGCGTYSVQVVNNGQPILESKRCISVQWQRLIDGSSASTVVIPVQGTDLRACCVGVNRIQPLLTEVIVKRDGIPVWQGFLLNDLAIGRDTITINAHDILGWTERRTIKNDLVHVGVDQTDIALAYLNDINAAADLPFVVTAVPTGILTDKTVLANEDRFASEALRDLYDTGLDATVVAGHLLLGPEIPNCGPIYIRDTDIDGDPVIKLDGRQRATRVVLRGANGIRGIFPPSPPDVCILPADYVQTNETILDQSTADIGAEEIYDRVGSAYPYYIEIPQGSALKPTTAVNINALIPGALVQFHSSALCLPVDMTMRLVGVDVEASGGTEQVRVTIEPLGGVEEFGEI